MSVEYDESFIKSLPITDICAIMNQMRWRMDNGFNIPEYAAIWEICQNEFNRRISNTFNF